MQCFYVLENWAGLEKLIATLPEGSPLLGVIGERFASVGICEHAVSAGPWQGFTQGFGGKWWLCARTGDKKHESARIVAMGICEQFQ